MGRLVSADEVAEAIVYLGDLDRHDGHDPVRRRRHAGAAAAALERCPASRSSLRTLRRREEAGVGELLERGCGARGPRPWTERARRAARRRRRGRRRARRAARSCRRGRSRSRGGGVELGAQLGLVGAWRRRARRAARRSRPRRARRARTRAPGCGGSPRAGPGRRAAPPWRRAARCGDPSRSCGRVRGRARLPSGECEHACGGRPQAARTRRVGLPLTACTSTATTIPPVFPASQMSAAPLAASVRRSVSSSRTGSAPSSAMPSGITAIIAACGATASSRQPAAAVTAAARRKSRSLWRLASGAGASAELATPASTIAASSQPAVVSLIPAGSSSACSHVVSATKTPKPRKATAREPPDRSVAPRPCAARPCPRRGSAPRGAPRSAHGQRERGGRRATAQVDDQQRRQRVGVARRAERQRERRAGEDARPSRARCPAGAAARAARRPRPS